MTIQTAGINLLSLEHAEAIQRLAADPAIAATTRMPHPYPENGARDFITRQLQEREQALSYVFVIQDHDQIVGVCGLDGIENREARELGFWVGKPFWGRGYATFGVKMVLEFAFRELRLERIPAYALESNAASRRVLEKSGFRFLELKPHQDPLLKRPDELLASYEITRSAWQRAQSARDVAQTSSLPRGMPYHMECGGKRSATPPSA